MTDRESRLHAVARWISAAAGLLVFAFSPAFAQGSPDPLPARVQGDANGVDLFSGAFGMSAVDVAIGDPASGGLAYSRSYVGSGWRSGLFGTVSSEGSTYYVSLGNSSDQFNESGGVFTSDEGAGATLSYNATTDEYTYTSAGGAVAMFEGALAGTVGPMEMNPGTICEAILTSVTAPTGAVTDYNYKTVTVASASESRLASVTNSFGYMLHLDYARDTDPGVAGDLDAWRELDKVTGINLAVDYCAPTAATCSGFTESWPAAIYVGPTDAPTSVTDPAGRATTYTYNASGNLTKVKWPGSTVDNIIVSYFTSGVFDGFVSKIDRGFADWDYAYVDASGERTTTVTLPGGGTRITKATIATGLVSSDTDPLSNVTSYLYDASDRITRVTAPEGNYVTYAYDARGNLTATTAVAKSGSGLSNIVTSATYPATCANQKTCNKPLTTTDARGKVTDYVYDASHGGVTKITAPDPDGAGTLVRPETRFTYAQKQARYKTGTSTFANGPLIWMPTETSACATLATCAGGADETKTVIAWPGTSSAQNLLPSSVTAKAGDNSLTTTTSFAYDAFGRLEETDGPLAGAADTSRIIYNAAGQAIGSIAPDPDGAGALKHPATRTTYNSFGQPTLVEQGTVANLTDDVFSAAFTALQKAETQYDAYGRPVKSLAYSGATSTLLAISQVSYDAAGRTDCVAQRMNPVSFATLPSSACTLGTAGSFGGDRIAKTTYNTAGQVLKTISAHGTALAQDTITRSYTTNGLAATLVDANGNKTTYEYDGHDRAVKTLFPSKTTAGTSSTTDYEELVYSDVAATLGLVTSTRKRDGRSITFTYDDLGRMTRRHVPGSANGNPNRENYDFTYDSFGRTKSAKHDGFQLNYKYDQLGRMTEKRHIASLPIFYVYDAASRLTTLTHPGGFAVDYAYDALGRVTSAVNGSKTLATVAYDDLGRRSSLTYGNGTSVSYGFDGGGRLDALDWNLGGTTSDFNYDFTYTPSSQTASKAVSDAAFDWVPGALAVDNYTANGLNQYTDVAGAAVSYDANGNVTTDHRGRTYTYDAENRLYKVKDGSTELNSYKYYADGNLSFSPGKRYYYDGDQEIAEYDDLWPISTGTLQRRYIRLPGSVDEPILMIDYTLDAGCTTTSYAACEVWAHQDRLGSVVATSDSLGNKVDTYTYSPYGESGAEGDAGFPFRFTGQKLDATTGLYYYKARWYDPEVGRFLQTDPIGYGDGMNMYAYVGGDPVNGTDPSGTMICLRVASRINNGLRGNCGGDSGGSGAGGGSSGGADANGDGFTDAFFAAPCEICDEYAIPDVVASALGGDQYVSQNIVNDVINFNADIFNFFQDCGIACSGRANDASYLLDFAAGGLGLAKGLVGLSARAIGNAVPASLSRVIAGTGPFTTLGAPSAADVFVVAADDIARITSPSQLARRLTIPQSENFTVITFPTPSSGLATPVFRSNPGFLHGGRTAGGAREFVLPNGPIPAGANIRVFGK